MAIFLSLGLGFFIKDLITNFITGIKFKFDASFNEGDRCIVDGDRAILVKVGIYESVFSIKNGRGHVWRFVPNERIKFLKIEKIIEEPNEVKEK
jgi:small-conductance mechanosensitive channel